jgi:F-type H+-transporting ATPase subunit epsilon
MRLLVTTPMAVVVDADAVCAVRAEDETGAFGIEPGHADFITALSISVITWRNHDEEEHHIAVRGGVLTVREGELVEVATREAFDENTLQRLGEAVLERFQKEAEAEEASQVSATRMHLAAIRQLQRYLEAGRQAIPRSGRPVAGVASPGDGLSDEGGMA